MGVASGPYLVIPVVGPSTVRDGLGTIVDLAFQPLTYILGPTELLFQLQVYHRLGAMAWPHWTRTTTSSRPSRSPRSTSTPRCAAPTCRAGAGQDRRGSSRLRTDAGRRAGRGDRGRNLPLARISHHASTAAAHLRTLAREIGAGAQGSWFAGFDPDRSVIFSFRATRSESKPSRLISDEYSDRRSASSLTVPFK